MGDIPLLKTGRHFRLESGDKVIVARDENECNVLRNLWKESDHLFVPFDFSGPTVILQGSDLKTALGKLAAYTTSSVRNTARVTHRHGGEKKTMFLDAF